MNESQAPEDDRLWTVTEAAKYLSLNKFSLYHLVSQKRIPVVKLSARCIRFRPSELSKWVESLTQQANGFSDGDRKSTWAIRKQTSSVRASGHK